MKKYKAVIITILFIIGLQIIAPAQSWHEKYWFYRYRFRQYFTDIGEGIGKSLVSDARNVHYNDTTCFDERKRIGVGDQTIDLAWYLGILALESYQLGGQDDMTLTELYYALKAYERLDKCEDKSPWNKPTAELDGFFMRYDVALRDGSYDYDMTNFNYGLSETDLFGKKPPGMPTYVNGFQTFEDVDWFNNLDLEFESKNTSMSQDQAAAMLMGLALVKKLAPSGTVEFYNTIENYTMNFNFQEHAEINALNITNYLKNSIVDIIIENTNDIFDIDNPFIEEIMQFSDLSDDFDFGNWIIVDPNDDLVYRGKDTRFARKGYIKACEYITNENISFQGDGFYEWEALAHFLDFNITPPGPYYNRIIWANLAVVGDSWNYTVPNPFGPDFELRTTPGTIDRLLKRCSDKRYVISFDAPSGEISLTVYEDYPEMDTDHEKLYNLIWLALHATSSQDNYDKIDDYEPKIEEILNSAPLCGPYNFAIDDSEAKDIEFDFDGCSSCMLPNRAPAGWRSSNRFRNEPSEFNGFKYPRTGNYPGHDYMMLYLLYRKYRMWWYGDNNGYGPFRNMIESNESQSYPYTQNNTFYGTISNPANLRSFETFYYNGKIEALNNQNGCLNIRAGNKIKLKAGCHIDHGSKFSAKIEKYNCWEMSNGRKANIFYDNDYIQDNNIGITGVKYTPEKVDCQENRNNTEIAIYPNPTRNFIHLGGLQINSDIQVRVCDINGNLLISRFIKSYDKINISHLNKGIYIVEIYDGKFLVKKKIIKL